MSDGSLTTPPKAPRIPTLDAARAVGVVAMVFGHTLDALLSAEARAAPGMVLYWKARGFTAPLFMLVSGWAVTVAIRRSRATGLDVPRGRLGRVLLLLVIGYGLRWPGWGLDQLRAGDPAVWSHLLAFDALHVIGVSLFVAALVLALPWTSREKVGVFALLGVLAATLAMRPPAPVLPAPAELPAPGLGMAVAQALGGTSPFPLFPWCIYFFAGAVVGLTAPADARRRTVALGLAGAAMFAVTLWTGLEDLPPAHPGLIAYRIGAVLLLLAALSAVPAAAAARLAPVGKASLGVYAIHIPIVWGWSTWHGLALRIGPSLSAWNAVLVAAVVLAASFGLHLALKHARGAGAAGLRRVRSALGGVALDP